VQTLRHLAETAAEPHHGADTVPSVLREQTERMETMRVRELLRERAKIHLQTVLRMGTTILRENAALYPDASSAPTPAAVQPAAERVLIRAVLRNTMESHTAEQFTERLTERIFRDFTEHTAEKLTERTAKTLTEHSTEKLTEHSAKTLTEHSTEKLTEHSERTLAEHFSEHFTEHFTLTLREFHHRYPAGMQVSRETRQIMLGTLMRLSQPMTVRYRTTVEREHMTETMATLLRETVLPAIIQPNDDRQLFSSDGGLTMQQLFHEESTLYRVIHRAAANPVYRTENRFESLTQILPGTTVQLLQNRFLTALAENTVRIMQTAAVQNVQNPTGMVLNTHLTNHYYRAEGAQYYSENASQPERAPRTLSSRTMTIIRTDRILQRKSDSRPMPAPQTDTPSAVMQIPAQTQTQIQTQISAQMHRTAQAMPQPDAYTVDTAMHLKREAAPNAPQREASPVITKDALIEQFGNLIDNPSINPPGMNGSERSIYGADPRDTTEQRLKANAEQLEMQKVQIEELTKKQAILEDGMNKYADPNRLYEDILYKLKNQIRLEKSRYMG